MYAGVKVKQQLKRPVTFVLSRHAHLKGLSADHRAHIASFISQQQALFYKASSCSAVLQKAFPVLKKIQLSYNKGRCLVSACAARPVLCINDHAVLTDTQCIVDRGVWDQKVLEALPAIKIAEGVTLSDGDFQVVKTLGYALAGLYQVEWFDESYIALHDVQHPRITVISSTAVKPIVIVSQVTDQLKESLLTRKKKGKYLSEWCIDVRFKNQMIVFPGGRA
jgi:hypothetical protein